MRGRMLIGLIFFLMAFPAGQAVAQQIKITADPDRLPAKKEQTTTVTIEVDVDGLAGFLDLPKGVRPPPNHPDEDPTFEVTIRSGKVSWLRAEPAGAAAKGTDSPFEFTIKRDRASGGKRARAKVILRYTVTDDAPPPGEVLIVVNGRQGLVLGGIPQAGSKVFEGLGRLNLLPVDGTPTSGPVLAPPFKPSEQQVNPTAEMAQRAAPLALLLGALALVPNIPNPFRKGRKRPQRVAEPQRPIPPPLPSPGEELHDKPPPRVGCDIIFTYHLQDYCANGEDAILLQVSALPALGWQAEIVPGSLRFHPAHAEPDTGGWHQMAGKVRGASVLYFKLPISWQWHDVKLNVTLRHTTVRLTAPGKKPQLHPLEGSITHEVPVLGANPKVFVQATPEEIHATGRDAAKIQVEEFWLFYQKRSVSGETFKITSVSGSIPRGPQRGMDDFTREQQDGFWTAPFLIQKPDYVEPVNLQVTCHWTGGEWWQKAMKHRHQQAIRHGPIHVLAHHQGFALPCEPCQVLVRGCTATCATVTRQFRPLPDMPLYARAKLLTADGKQVPNPFEKGNDKVVCANGAGIVCEVLDLSQGKARTINGCKCPPSLAIDLPAGADSPEKVEKWVRDIFRTAKEEKKARPKVAVDQQGNIYTTDVRPGPFQLVSDNDVAIEVMPREPILFLGKYRVDPDPASEPIHDGPVAYTLALDDGLGGKLELRGACLVAFDSLVLETGGPDFRFYEYNASSLEVEHRPRPCHRLKPPEALAVNLTWQFAVVDEAGQPLAFAGSVKKQARLAGTNTSTPVSESDRLYLIMGHTPRDREIYVNLKTGKAHVVRVANPAWSRDTAGWRHVEQLDRALSSYLRGEWRKLPPRLILTEKGLRWLPLPGEEHGQPNPAPGADQTWPWEDKYLSLAIRIELRDLQNNLLATSDRLMDGGGRTPAELVWRDHRFKYVLLMLRFFLKDSLGQPFADRNYLLEINGKRVADNTGPHGVVEQLIPPDAEEGTLTIMRGSGATERSACEFKLKLGRPDSAAEVRGAQALLNNLGLFAGSQIDGQEDQQFTRALQRFQALCHLEPGGKLEDETVRLLRACQQRGFPSKKP